MRSFGNLSSEVAELAGLWIAEGDDKTEYEITITNNCFPLIKFSYKILKKLFKPKNFRIYIYTSKKRQMIKERMPEAKIRRYVDKRATKPYFILRVANVGFVKEWKKIVQEICKQQQFYPEILRGFFAGEGNIKTGTHSNRTVRIAQKNRIDIIDKMLNYFKIEWKFSPQDRSYEIVGRQNWEKLAKINIADLHPVKKKSFWNVYNSYRQWHYKKHHIRDKTVSQLSKPKTSDELAIQFNRSVSRIRQILSRLKKVGGVKNYRVGSKTYWVKSDANIIPVSKRKKAILNFLAKPKRTYQIATYLDLDEKSVFRRLTELKKLGLVSREEYYWHKIDTDAEVRLCE
jgi:predicted transcriptional regulator